MESIEKEVIPVTWFAGAVDGLMRDPQFFAGNGEHGSRILGMEPAAIKKLAGEMERLGLIKTGKKRFLQSWGI